MPLFHDLPFATDIMTLIMILESFQYNIQFILKSSFKSREHIQMKEYGPYFEVLNLELSIPKVNKIRIYLQINISSFSTQYLYPNNICRRIFLSKSSDSIS